MVVDLQQAYYALGSTAAVLGIVTAIATRAAAQRREVHRRIDSLGDELRAEQKKMWERVEANTRQGDACERVERDLRALEDHLDVLRRDAEGKHSLMDDIANRRHEETRAELRHVREDITKLSVLVAKAGNGGFK